MRLFSKSTCDAGPSQQQRLEDDRERADKAEQYLEEFAYVVSHDLRNPLRAINGFSELLFNEYRGQLDDKGERYLKRIIDGSVRVQQMIGCITEFSQICSKEPEFVDVEINELMEQVIDELCQEIEGAAAVVTYDPLPTVSGDAFQLLQLFRHLFENAIRFRSEMQLRIHVSYEASEAGDVFKVSDNGIGIAKTDHENAFTMFRRVGIQDSKNAGLGAGLAICRRIVERHGGQIKLESEPGIGTAVIFSIDSQTHPSG